jgi:Mg2+/citrate symporter
MKAEYVGYILAFAVAIFIKYKWVDPWFKRLSAKVQDMILVVMATLGSLVMWGVIAWAGGFK